MNLKTIANKYRLNDTEKNILYFLEKNIEATKELGIRGVAKNCFTSPATIVNLAKKLNFSGYSELLFKIKESGLETENFHQELTSGGNLGLDIKDYEKQFSQLLTAYKNKNMMILASGFSQIIANYLNESLVINGFRSMSNSHLELLEPEYAQQTLVVAISESGETTALKEIILKAQKNQIDIISFTGNPQSTIAHASTLAIRVGQYNQFADQKYTPHLFYGNTLNLFELLLSAYFQTTNS